MDVPEDITVKQYFEEIVPKMVEEQLAKAPIAGMEGTEFTIEFDVKGDQDYVYGITVKDAKDVNIAEGALESPMIKLELSEDVWRKAVTGKLEGAMDAFTNMGEVANRKRYDALRSTKGTMNLEVGMPDGSTANIKVVFNNADSPAVTFKAALEDWAKVQSGELPGPMAFMQGKLKIDGDMSFAMSLGNLLA